ncbi:phage tail tape measure protein, partial [Clostridium sp.]|uniref:phage tail tape measure protein n=1 Tax=Clostridium sp. TaxID=1506 RepID=UPI002FC75A91
MSDIKYKLSFDVDKRGIVGIQQDLDQMVRTIHQMAGGQSGFTKEVSDAFKATELLKTSLTNAHNGDLGKMNTKKFTKELKAAGTSLTEIEYKLNKVGASGGQAFDSLNKNIRQTGVEVKHTSKLMDSMFDTIGKTVKWSIASQMMNQLGGSVQRAIGFTKALDESLNNIQVVSGKNATEMKVFADEANNAAQALGKSTTEYTDASLIFFQQGKSADEVRMLTEATLKGANVTGTEVAEMAELLTAVMNGYGVAAEHALAITDKLAAVGAATGADFEELATGMSKVASMADIAGVSVDQLGAQLATITTVTKEAPESIGTSLKTIYGRVAEIKVGKEDEEGWDLGKVEDAFNKVGLSVLNANREMKDVGAIMEEIGPMWKDFNRESQLGLANAMAGQRQANRLIALFNNWEMYTDALNVSQTSLGATTEQNEIRMESMSYKSKQLRTEIEQLWMNLINSDFLKAGTDLLTSAVSGVNSLVESINGVGGALTLVGGIALAVFGRQIGTSLDRNIEKIGSFSQRVKSIPDSMKEKKNRKSGKMSQEDEIEYDSRQKQKQEEKIVSQGASKEDKKRYNEALEVSRKKIELKEVEALRLKEIKEQVAKLDREGEKQEEIASKKAIEISKKKTEMEAKAAKAQRTHDTEKRLSLATAKNISKEGEGLSYKEQLQVMTDTEKKNLGMTDAELAKFTSLEDVITRIKRATVKDGLISTQQDMVEVKALEAEIEKLNKEKKAALGKARGSYEDIATISDDQMKSENTIARLENDAKESTNIVNNIVDESARKLKSINFTKIAGTAAAAFAI